MYKLERGSLRGSLLQNQEAPIPCHGNVIIQHIIQRGRIFESGEASVGGLLAEQDKTRASGASEIFLVEVLKRRRIRHEPLNDRARLVIHSIDQRQPTAGSSSRPRIRCR